MGLAGAKNKRRLGNDPNNTKWSRNTETFGQKLLRSQGWEPGQYLGSKDATHAVSYTEASTSHIRVTMKDDVLGLGAKRNNGDECTGLNAFQHLLGRLNGKSEDILAAEEKKREDTKLSLYVERKLGRINFVRGGWLVGDTLKEQPSADAPEVTSGESSQEEGEEEESTEASEPPAEKKSSRKRKAEQEDTEKADDKEVRKKEKKSKRRKTDSDDDAETDSKNTNDKKKEKKSKKRKVTDSEEGDTEPTEAPKSSKKGKKDKERQSMEGSSEDVDNDAKKAAKKEKKREKKAKEEKRKKDKPTSESSAEDKKEKKKRRRKEKEASASLASGVSTPTEGGSGYSTPTVTTNTRYLARSRFIAQKKLAFADTAALNQIFMIKS